MTKSGDIAGPRILEHIVDVVLYLEVITFDSKLFLKNVGTYVMENDKILL